MSSPDQPQFNSGKEQLLQVNLASRLNERFRTGAYLWHQDTRRLIKRIPRPICVDLDNTLVTYFHDESSRKLGFKDDRGQIDDRWYEAAPDAHEALAALREIGTVVILTGNNSSYDRRQQWLEHLGLWHPATVMIDAWNYRADLSLEKRKFIFPQANRYVERMNQERMRIINEYLEERGINAEVFGRERWAQRIAPKSVAAAFDKPYDLPIIDDDQFNTQHIPGMFGILIQGVLRKNYYDDLTGELQENNPAIPLMEAVERVKAYYAKVGES